MRYFALKDIETAEVVRVIESETPPVLSAADASRYEMVEVSEKSMMDNFDPSHFELVLASQQS